MPTWIFTLFTELPAVVSAIEQILATDAAKTVEQAIGELVSHITPGKPNSAALGPDAEPKA